MSILEDLYYGGMVPYTQVTRNDPEQERLRELIEQNKAALFAAFTPAQRDRFDRLSDCLSELAELIRRKTFAAGFVMGANILMEVHAALQEE